MMQAKRILLVAVLALFVLAFGLSAGADTVTAPGQSLAEIHQAKEQKCASCHAEGMKVDDNETAVNGACVSCHGSLADLGARSKHEINPHKSHLGGISCTVCHHGHIASKSYCLNCHTYDMKIPGSTAKKDIGRKIVRRDTVADTADVVVIGAGAAGYTAAITAHDAGAKVILLEKMPITGGNSMLAAGGMNAANTKFQAAKKIQDSVELMYKDTMSGGKNVNNPELVKILADNSSASVDWLTSIGADISDVGRMAGASVYRTHRPAGGAAVGAHIINVLRKNAEDRKMDVRVNSKVVELLRDVDGKVTGVQVEGKHRGLYSIRAKTVVVAAGGFSANAQMVEQYQPSFAGMTTSNQPGAQGEGTKLGEAAGGQLIDMKEIQIHPTVAAGSRILITEAVRGNGAILINREGNRFVNELTTRDAASAAILKQTGRSAFLVFDEGIRKSLKQIDGYFHLDLVKEGATPAALAKAMGVPAEALTASLDAYNTAFDMKNDPAFNRPDLPRALRTSKFYAIEVKPGIHYTMGGLRINGQAQVMNKDGRPVPNLYAAGEVTGGVHGANRLGGNSISETITFGRIAGTNAAQQALGR